MVADYIGSIHHSSYRTTNVRCDANTVEMIESYDTTPVRASTPMLLPREYIKENTDITVYSGEGSDEASGSYLYFQNAPDDESFINETIRILKDLHYFYVLRCDKSISGDGLEARVNILYKYFLDFYMIIPAIYKRPHNGTEKYLLRKSFDVDNLLPSQVLWRQKEGFSDGCSSKSKSWYEIIQEHVEKSISDTEFKNIVETYKFNPPKIKESLWYRMLFDEFYKGREITIPYYWLPK